jgi:hypothetical protein
MTVRDHYSRLLARLLMLRAAHAGRMNALGADMLDRCIYACEIEIAHPRPEAVP